MTNRCLTSCRQLSVICVTHLWCVVRALKAWKETTQGKPTGFIFRSIETAGESEELTAKPIAIKTMVSYVRSGVLACGEESAASWSCRGFVTENAHRGMAVVMEQTRHKTLAAASVYMRSAEMFDAGF